MVPLHWGVSVSAHPDATVRTGVIGLGSVGKRHAMMIDQQVPALELAAVCDRDTALTREVADAAGAEVAAYDSADALLADESLEAVVVATPHSRHICFAEPALRRGLHVLVEKPVAMSVEGAARINAAYAEAKQKRPDLVFAAMFQQRLMPVWQRLREVVATELGTLQRVHWTVTDWFRTKAYYASGGWRGTWQHEGGGVLMNQAPHNLDLLLWMTGLTPQRVTAVTRYGRFHDVEVEDEVSAIIECHPEPGQPHGPIATFLTTTGEAPGTNRLEIVGNRGTAVAEDGTLRIRQLHQSIQRHNDTGPANLRTVDTTERVETPGGTGSPTYTDQKPFRLAIFQNFATAIRHATPVAAAGTAGLASVELANAMLLSGDQHQPVELPLDIDRYQHWLIAKTRGVGG